MGEVAARLSDVVVVTSDNPRTEDPAAIIADVVEGLKGIRIKKIVEINRTKAIKKAIAEAAEDDIILLAGKGHETYQIIGTEKHHYDEREIVKDILENKL